MSCQIKDAGKRTRNKETAYTHKLIMSRHFVYTLRTITRASKERGRLARRKLITGPSVCKARKTLSSLFHRLWLMWGHPTQLYCSNTFCELLYMHQLVNYFIISPSIIQYV